jgi:hypothetical protein
MSLGVGSRARLGHGRPHLDSDGGASAAAPTAPSGLTATKSTTTAGAIDLAWTDNSSDETAFAIFQSTDNVSYSEVTTAAANATSKTITGLTPGTLYYFKVKARNGNGDSAATTAASANAASSLLTGMVDFWKLADTSAVNGNTLTNTNAVTFSAGKASFVSASSQSLSRSTQVWGVTNALTVSLWHQVTADGTDRIAFQAGANMAAPTGSEFKIQTSASGGLGGYVLLENDVGSPIKLYSGIPETGSLIHAVFTWDGGNLKVYRNGAEITGTLNKLIDTTGAMTNVTRPIFIGCGQNGGGPSFFENGTLDAVGLWSRALTSAEITELYNGGTALEHPF